MTQNELVSNPNLPRQHKKPKLSLPPVRLIDKTFRNEKFLFPYIGPVFVGLLSPLCAPFWPSIRHLESVRRTAIPS